MSPEVESIFRDAAELDVELSVASDGDRVHYRGWITEGLKTRIVEHRDEILAALQSRPATTTPELACAIALVLAIFPGAKLVKVGSVDGRRP